MDTQDRLLAQQACLDVVITLFRCLDARDHAGASTLFATDGTWDRQGQTLCGPDQIQQALDRRQAGRHTAHVITNAIVTIKDEVQAQVSFLLTAYETSTTSNEARLAGIRSCVDELIYESAQWRIRARRSKKLLPPE